MTMPINHILHDEITKLNNSLIPPGFKGDVREVRVMQECLKKKIDYVGGKSATAQGLNKVITNTERLRASDQILYLLKDANANGGDGELIGILKIGHKNLYLFDENCKSWQVEPLCVLDFYVLEDYQHQGCGKKLFDYMLHDQCKRLDELAIDSPSPKLEGFLKKYFGTPRLMRHSNNFAVTPKFFENVLEVKSYSNSGRCTPNAASVGRYAAAKPDSGIANIIHGGNIFGYNQGAPSDEIKQSDRDRSSTHTPELQIDVPDLPEVQDYPEYSQDIETTDTVLEDYKNQERPSTLEVRPPSRTETNVGVTPAGSTSTHPEASLTDRGYFDVKYYHNKLW